MVVFFFIREFAVCQRGSSRRYVLYCILNELENHFYWVLSESELSLKKSQTVSWYNLLLRTLNKSQINLHSLVRCTETARRSDWCANQWRSKQWYLKVCFGSYNIRQCTIVCDKHLVYNLNRSNYTMKNSLINTRWI
jgi:hypothetical protein